MNYTIYARKDSNKWAVTPTDISVNFAYSKIFFIEKFIIYVFHFNYFLHSI